jgi:hypothetical protein
MGLVDRLFDAMQSAVQLRSDINRVEASTTRLADSMMDHEKRLVRLETRDELRVISLGRQLPPGDA